MVQLDAPLDLAALQHLNGLEVTLQLRLLAGEVAQRTTQALNLGSREREQIFAQLDVGVDHRRRFAGPEQRVGGCDRVFLRIDRGAVPHQHSVIVDAVRLMGTGPENQRLHAEAVGDGVLDRGAWCREIRLREGRAGEARDNAFVGLSFGVIEPLVHVDVRFVLLERPENAEVALVERKVGAIAIRDLGAVMLGGDAMRHVEQHEALGCR